MVMVVGPCLIGWEWELWELACPVLALVLTRGRVRSPYYGTR